MRQVYQIIDDFCPVIDVVRHSALGAGLGRYSPKEGDIGSSDYDGIGLFGHHAPMFASLRAATEDGITPNSMFFRGTKPGGDKGFVHSDREMGSHTCVAYMSEHDEAYGTGFFRHKKLGLDSMPPLAEAMAQPYFEELRNDVSNPDSDSWEQVDYVPGKYNRAVIFDAPLFHARMPIDGIGHDFASARLVWVSHFFTPPALAAFEGKYHD